MILVTGATGLLGSFVCRELLSQGASVRALKQITSPMNLIWDIYDKIQWIDGQINNPLAMDDAMEGVTKVIHCAALVSFHRGDRDLLYKINVNGTEALINAAQKNGIIHFTQISSVAALGRQSNSGQIDENQRWEDSKLNSFYAQTKHEADLLVFRAQTEGMRTTILYPSIILGPISSHRSSTLMLRFAAEKPLFYTPGITNYVDVRDMAAIAVKATMESIGGEYIASAGSISYATLFEKVAELKNNKKPQLKATKWLMRLAWFVTKIKNIFTKKRGPITRETIMLSNLKIAYDNTLIKKELSVDFRPLSETLSWCLKK